jgi:hypothetical protein
MAVDVSKAVVVEVSVDATAVSLSGGDPRICVEAVPGGMNVLTVRV